MNQEPSNVKSWAAGACGALLDDFTARQFLSDAGALELLETPERNGQQKGIRSSIFFWAGTLNLGVKWWGMSRTEDNGYAVFRADGLEPLRQQLAVIMADPVIISVAVPRGCN
jgi:hypothetical protein